MIAKIKKIPKIYIISVLVILVVLFSVVATPTFSRLINGIFTDTTLEWNGDIASSYAGGIGTVEAPYEISTPSELAYFSKMLETTDYDNTYFELTNDLIMNKGVFSYNNDLVIYNYQDNQYYLEPYTNNLYNDEAFSQLVDISLYDFNSISNFKGHLDGNFYSIYGLYITDKEKEQLALFDILEGPISDVFIEHILVYGSNNVSGLATSILDTTLENVYVSGLAISNNSTVKSEEIVIQDISYEVLEDTYKIDFNNETFKNKNITSIKLEGNYDLLVEDKNFSLMIDGKEISKGDFSIDFDGDLTNGIIVNNNTLIEDVGVDTVVDETIPNSESQVGSPEDNDLNSEEVANTVSLSGLKVTIEYTDTIVSGISDSSSNVNYTNIVSKVDLYGPNGVGFTNQLFGSNIISNSYNQGDINTLASSIGLVNNINEDSTVEINNSYNSGGLTAKNKVGLVNKSNGIVNITNSFNASEGSFVGSISYDLITITNSYNYLIDDSYFTKIIKDSNVFYSNDFLSILEFNKFEDGPENVWVYNTEDYPTLYYLDQLNLVEINITNNSWDNYSNDSTSTYYNNNITAIVSNEAPIYNLKDVKYYISKDGVVLDKTSLMSVEWISYDGPLAIEEEGKYIVYIKLVDYSDKERVINTGVLNIDKTSPIAEIALSDNIWNAYTTDVNRLAVDESQTITINSWDNSAGINSVSYTVTNEIMSEEQLGNANWIPYENGINIDPEGEKIVYARVTDNSLNTTYLNTSLLSFEGYVMNEFTVGRVGHVPTGSSIIITDTSSIAMNFTYLSSNIALSDYEHRVTSTINLPLNTKLILQDNINNKQYEYVVTAADALSKSYSFTKFREIGSLNNYYVPSNYVNGDVINENFDLIIDFGTADINASYYNIGITLEVVDSSGVVIRNTIGSSIKTFDMYNNRDASVVTISSTPSVDIKYNAESITPVNINTRVAYRTVGSNIIWDSTLEEQDIVLKIRILDSLYQPVDVDGIKSFALEIDGVEYFSDRDGEFIIELDQGLAQLDKTLNIIAYESDTFLAEGDYFIEIVGYVSFNRYLTDLSDTMFIPLNVSANNMLSSYEFDVEMTGNVVIDRDNAISAFDFVTLLHGPDNPNLKVAFYEKASFDPIDQTYNLVNINDYLTTPIPGDIGVVRATITRNFGIVFDTTKLAPNGYRLVIEAYDGDQKIDEIIKNIVVK